MDIADARVFTGYWDNFRGRTRRIVALVPPDRIEWTPAEGKWSPGDIARHLAGIERDMYGENVQGRPSRYPGHDVALAGALPEVLAYHDRKHAEAMEIFRHEAHHRGQLYFMLGLLGVATPPLFGLTEEEVRSRSATG